MREAALTKELPGQTAATTTEDRATEEGRLATEKTSAQTATDPARRRAVAKGRSHLDAIMVRPEALDPNPYQPRSSVQAEDVSSLADSLRESGMLQPIVARRAGTQLQIVAGERRWRAAQAAGLDLVPVLVRDATDEQMLEMALVENIQRTDLNAIEKARAYQRLRDEFALSPEEVGQRVGEDRTTVTNYLRLLELPTDIRDLVSRNDISMGHARSLLGIDRLDEQLRLAKSIVANQLSVRALEEIVRRTKSPGGQPSEASPSRREKSPHVKDLEGRFERATGVKVTIKESRRKGRGRIILEYNSLDDFDRLAVALGVEFD
jgi:ParB family chromosome partitioning protein